MRERSCYTRMVRTAQSEACSSLTHSGNGRSCGRCLYHWLQGKHEIHAERVLVDVNIPPVADSLNRESQKAKLALELDRS